MTEKIKQIAMRIRGLREIADVSIDEVAKQFNIPKATYKKYESGTVDIPVSFLYEFAQKFNVELTAILSGEEPRLRRYSLVKKGQGLSTERRKDYKYQDLAFNFIRKKAEVFCVTVEPKKKDAVHYNNHAGQEFTYVLEGTLNVVFDGHEVVLNKGDALYFDSGQNHAMVALKGKPAKFLAVIL